MRERRLGSPRWRYRSPQVIALLTITRPLTLARGVKVAPVILGAGVEE